MPQEPQQFQSIFDMIPTPIWVEDFSEVKNHLISIGLFDLDENEVRFFLQENLEIVNSCIANFKVVSLNQACVELHKAKSKEDLLKNMHKIFSLDSLNTFIEQLVCICTKKYYFEGKTTVKTFTNEIVSILIKSKVMIGYEDSLSKVIVTTEDITNQVIQLESLQRNDFHSSNERFIYASQAISDAIWDWNVETGEVFWSSGFYSLFGHKPGIRKEKEDVWENNIHPNDYPFIKSSLDAAKSNPNQLKWSATYRFRKNDGNYAYVSEHSLILRDKNGKAVRMIGALQDITSQKESEKSIIQKTKYLQVIASLVESLLSFESWESVLVRNLGKIGEASDVDRVYLLANQTIKNTNKLCSKKQYIWSKLDEETSKTTDSESSFSLEDFPNIYRQALKKEAYSIKLSSVENPHLKSFMVENRIQSLLLIPIHSKNTLFGFLGFDECQYERDWTEEDISFLQTIANNFGNAIEKEDFELSLQKLNLELKESNHELEISNGELEQFAFVASHDLQEPLRMITSFLSLLEKKYSDQLDEKAKSYINYAVDGAFRMRQIILDLLEFSRVGGKSNIEITRFESVHAILEACDLLAKKIIETNAKINMGTFPIIQTNKSAFIQLVQNILSNSLKYSKKGVYPVISITSKDVGDSWEFSIEDNGIGIPKEYHGKIFNVFQRLHDKNTYSGTGIGLAICKRIVDHIGGQIGLDSRENIGSRFYFTIPKRVKGL
ncbi:ATP-binding protein [Belliella sp. DSM 111904]|uniref:histidine kinase n=1 Tax=Belliella filtrata TaxID=2923435 RepID=A0ABS9V5J1_9BACT|nr:ATP-binding protein [Belliella filtrata]MCH7411689.1 ATP-binding protein [Belliella filtrata]